jgi:aminopeptidase N
VSSRSLVNTADDIYLQTKAMWVWWMLRDLVGETQLNMILFSYQASEDNDPSYMPHVIAAHTQRDLQWFFDDWVYHDRGLPDLKVESAFAASTATKSFLLTITLDNLGTAGAEVPVTIKFAGGEVTKRIEVRAKSKATFRVETPASPQEIRVNDGSVPESDMTNNTFKVEAPQH